MLIETEDKQKALERFGPVSSVRQISASDCLYLFSIGGASQAYLDDGNDDAFTDFVLDLEFVAARHKSSRRGR